jgi:hypothetical protein
MFERFLFAAVALCAPLQAIGQSKYLDQLSVVMLDDGRKAKLNDKFRFQDDRGEVWQSPARWVVDGASIPWPAWSLIGGPWSGKHRSAAVIHDYYCDANTKPWREVHQVFYDAMIASGVSVTKAKTMYFAVYAFGPRWDTLRSGAFEQECDNDYVCTVKQRSGHEPAVYYAGPFGFTEAQKHISDVLRDLIRDPSIPLEELERRGDKYWKRTTTRDKQFQ